MTSSKIKQPPNRTKASNHSASSGKSPSKGPSDSVTNPQRAKPARPVLHVSHGAKKEGLRDASHSRVTTKSPSFSERSPSIPPEQMPPPPRRKHLASPATASDTVQLAASIAHAALDKKAAHVEIIDLAGKIDYADYLVLMSGGSERHVHAISTGIIDSLRKTGKRPLSVEGLAASTWVLLDYGDVVVHVFHSSSRAVYDLDGLWLDAARVPINNEPAAPEKKPASAPAPTNLRTKVPLKNQGIE